jgi:DNA-binding response OmpR family regulator
MESNALILIVDDDINLLTTTAAFLSQHGYRCDCADTGEEALACLKQRQYDLLISDIEMPGNHDLRLIQSLPQIQAGLPVILMTGYPTIQTAAHAVGLSVVAYLIKPVDPETLLAEVARSLERSRYFRKVAGTRERLISVCEDLKHIETSIRIPVGNEIRASLVAFLDLTLQNVTASLLDLRYLIESMAFTSKQSPEPEWLQSSRPLILISALRETIAVLAKTKESFKSKELGEIRHKLEALLREHPAKQEPN